MVVWIAAKPPKPPKEIIELLVRVRAHLKTLNSPEDWWKELTRLRQLSVDHKLWLHRENPNILDLDDGVGQIAVPVVHVLEQHDEEYLLRQKWLQLLVNRDAPDEHFLDMGRRIPPDWLPGLFVSFNASDEVILDTVKRILEERKRPGVPVRKPGRHGLTRPFDRYTFDKWRNNRIVELAELLAWNAQRPEPYRDYVLGGWLEKTNRKGKVVAFDEKETYDAKAVLREALASLPALFNQLRVEEAQREEEAQRSKSTPTI